VVYGLDTEDTIAHYDTVDGQRIVQPSNRVSIYSPRFAAVRQVVTLEQKSQRIHLSGVHLPTTLVQHHWGETPRLGQQQLQARRQIGRDQLAAFRARHPGEILAGEVRLQGMHDERVKPSEAAADLAPGRSEAAELAWLAEGIQAAVAWSHDAAVQVILDHQAAAAVTDVDSIGVVYTVDQPPPNPKLQIVKTASTASVKPGETVQFTLYFDNVGNQVIGNVTIIDNLTARLEYVPDSAQCSLPSRFSTQQNEAGSLVLRWEITDPLEPDQGGVIRFTCRVR